MEAWIAVQFRRRQAGNALPSGDGKGAFSALLYARDPGLSHLREDARMTWPETSPKVADSGQVLVENFIKRRLLDVGQV
jgi:hypothetical protein